MELIRISPDKERAKSIVKMASMIEERISFVTSPPKTKDCVRAHCHNSYGWTRSQQIHLKSIGNILSRSINTLCTLRVTFCLELLSHRLLDLFIYDSVLLYLKEFTICTLVLRNLVHYNLLKITYAKDT